MKKIVGLMLLLLLALPVAAATVAAGETYNLSAGETVAGNLYAAGGNVTIAGTVTGDLIVAGGKLSLSGAVRGDLHAAGGSVDILGGITGDLRVAGGDIVVSGPVGGDLVIFGGTVQVLDGVLISGDVIAYGGTVTLDGVVRGGVRIGGGAVTLRGESGAVTAEADSLVLEGARVRGAFTYSSPKEATIDEATTIDGKISYTDTGAAAANLAVVAAFLGGAFFFGKFLIMLVTTLLAYFLWRNTALGVGRESVASFGRSTLWGFISLIVIPAASVLLLITIIGSLIGAAGLLGYILLLMVANVFSGIVAGAMLSRALVREVRITVPWILFGVVFLQLVVLIPLVGWIISLLVFLATFGILARRVWQRSEQLRSGTQTPEA